MAKAKSYQVRNDSELSDEKGKWRDKAWYDHHAAKTRTPTQKIDGMVRGIEDVHRKLREQDEWAQCLDRAERLLAKLTDFLEHTRPVSS